MNHPCSLSRRGFLTRSGLGLGSLALGGLLRDAGLLSAAPIDPTRPLARNFTPCSMDPLPYNGGPGRCGKEPGAVRIDVSTVETDFDGLDCHIAAQPPAEKTSQ